MIYLGWFTIIFVVIGLGLFGAFCHRIVNSTNPGLEEKRTTMNIAIWTGILLVLAYLNEISRVFIVGVVT